MFQPRNRNITTLIPMPGTEPPRLIGKWYATDIDSSGEPFAWEAEGYRCWVTRDRSSFIVVDGGNYLRYPNHKNGRRGNVRRFPTALEAAAFAEDQAWETIATYHQLPCGCIGPTIRSNETLHQSECTDCGRGWYHMGAPYPGRQDYCVMLDGAPQGAPVLVLTKTMEIA